MSDTPGPLPPPPRRSHGCLWGCLIAAGIAVAAIVFAVYTGWHLLSTMKDDPTVKMVVADLARDPVAERVLGGHIALESISSLSVDSDLEKSTESFNGQVTGDKGAGSIAAIVVTRNHVRTIMALTLTGPDGRTYDLLHPSPVPDNSI